MSSDTGQVTSFVGQDADAVGRQVSSREVAQAVLEQTGLLDAAEADALHAVAELAAWICGTSMAAVSLVQDHRQFFAGAVGLAVRETAREDSFCAVAMQTPDRPLLVPDAHADPRFAANALVTGDLRIRSYAGVPLVAPEGVALGAVCALGDTPMALSGSQVSALGSLAAVAVELLQARRTATRLAVALEQVQAARAQEAVSREQFRSVFEHAPLGMTLVDPDGTYLQVNAAFAAMLGRRPEALVGAGSWTVSAPEDAPDDAATGRRLLAARRRVSLREKRYLHADGTRVPALVTTSLVQAQPGRRPVLLNQVESVAARRAAEDRLLEVQSAYDGIISIDDRGRVTAWNLGAQRLLGHPAAVMLGQPLDRVIPPELLGAHQDGVRRAAAGGAPRLLDTTTDVPAAHADGHVVHVELSLSAWAQDDRTGYTAVLRDVTARRRADLLAGLIRHTAATANSAQTSPLPPGGCWSRCAGSWVGWPHTAGPPTTRTPPGRSRTIRTRPRRAVAWPGWPPSATHPLRRRCRWTPRPGWRPPLSCSTASWAARSPAARSGRRWPCRCWPAGPASGCSRSTCRSAPTPPAWS